MHTGYYVGFFLAAGANYFIGSRLGWRYLFLVGGVPALLVAFIRNNVSEPIHWERKRDELGSRWKMHHAFFEPFFSSVPPANGSQLYLSDRFAGRLVGWISLRTGWYDLHRDPSRP